MLGGPYQPLGAHIAAQRAVRFQGSQTRDGLGFDWPLSYADVAPYYDKVELLVGDIRQQRRPGEHARFGAGLSAAATKAHRQRSADCPARAAHRYARHRRPPRGADAATRLQELSRALAPGQSTRAEASSRRTCDSGAACFWATPCGRGCAIRANYQSTTVHLPPALATGNLDIITDAMVHEITVGKDGRADGVNFIDKQERQAAPRRRARHRARRRFLRDRADPAQLQERLFPQRACELKRQGRPLSDGYRRQRASAGRFRFWRVCRRSTRTGRAKSHVYTPWWLYKEQLAGKLGFARGYHIEFGGGRRMPGCRPSRASSGSPAAATARSSRRMPGATMAPSSVSTAAAR